MSRTNLVAIALFALAMLISSSANAQDAVSLMKFEIVGDVAAERMEAVNEAVKKQVREMGYVMSAEGGDVLLADVEFIIDGCDVTQDSCLDQAAALFNAQHLVYGAIVNDGTTTLIWYSVGKGIQREVTAMVSDAASAETLATRVFVGETGTLIVSTGSEPGAEVKVDGEPVGLTPYEGPLPIGSVSVEVSKPGFLTPSTQTVEVRQGASTEVTFTLEVDSSMVVGGETSTLTIAGWVVTGVGGALLIGGGITGGLMLSQEAKLKDEVNAENWSAALDARESGDSLALTTNILLGVGGAAAIAGVTMVIVGMLDEGEVDEAESASFDVAPLLGQGTTGVQLGLTF